MLPGETDRPLLVVMHGYTAAGKSSTAARLGAAIANIEVHQTALVRQDLRLTPRDLAKQVGQAYEFSLHDPVFAGEISRKVYGEVVHRGERSLTEGRDTVLDGSFSFRWQRELAYEIAERQRIQLIVLQVVCSDEELIRARLSERAARGSLGLDEASSWKSYLSTIEASDPVSQDILPAGEPPAVLRYDTATVDLEWMHSPTWTSPKLEQVCRCLA